MWYIHRGRTFTLHWTFCNNVAVVPKQNLLSIAQRGDVRPFGAQIHIPHYPYSTQLHGVKGRFYSKSPSIGSCMVSFVYLKLLMSSISINIYVSFFVSPQFAFLTFRRMKTYEKTKGNQYMPFCIDLILRISISWTNLG